MSYFKQEVAARQWHLSNLPELAHPQKIETMNYSHNSIRHIPAHLTLAVQLREIDLSHNRIENIDILGRLVTLRSVKMSNNQISKLGVGLATLTGLQHFDLRQNKLATLVSIEVIRKMLDRRRGFMDVLLDGNQVFRKKRETIDAWINSEYALQPFSARESSKELMGPTVKLRDKQGKKRRNDALNGRLLDLEETVRSRAEKKQENNSPPINQALANTQNASVKVSEKKLMEITQQNLEIITANLSLLRTSLTFKLPQQLKEMMEKLLDIAGVLGEWLVRAVEEASEDYVAKVQKLSGELKEYHTRIINYLQDHSYAPVEQYTRITKELKKLREITGFILQRVRCIIQVNGRRQALLSIVNISPQKPATRLEEMLLSASEKKSSCDGCFYLTAEVEQLKKKLKEAQVSLDELQAREKEHLEREEGYKTKIAEMTRIGSREEEMQQKQKIILGQLQCKITPSTYQHVLLQQAKSIELMLKERGKAEEEGQKKGKWAYFSKDKSKSRMHSLGSQQKPLKTPDLLGSKQNMDSNQQGVSAFQIHEKSEASGKEKETRTRTSGREGSVNEPKREHTVLSFKEDWVGAGESPLRESVKSGSARNMRNVNMADSLREADRYKKYVQYHLRNSIINLLSKKGVEERRRSKLPVVGHFIHKTHCT